MLLLVNTHLAAENDGVTCTLTVRIMPKQIAKSEYGCQAGSHMLLPSEAKCRKLLEYRLIFFLD